MASFDVVVKLKNQTQAQMRQIEAGLAQIEARTKRVNDAMTTLGTGIGRASAAIVAGLGAATVSAVRFANTVDDVSNATNIARGDIIAFARATQAAGGSTEGAISGLLKFQQNLVAAAGGNKELLESFKQLGVGTREIENNTVGANLLIVIDSLGKLTDKSKAAALQVAVLNKSFSGVEGTNLSSTFNQLRSGAAAVGTAAKSSADATGVLEGAFARLQDRILTALKPLNDFIVGLDPAKLDRFIDATAQLALSIAALAAAAKALQFVGAGLIGLGAAFASFKLGAAIIATGTKNASFGLTAFGATTVKLLKTLRDGATYTGTFAKKSVELAGASQILRQIFKNLGTTLLTIVKYIANLAVGFVRMIPFLTAAYVGFQLLDFAVKGLTDTDIVGWAVRAGEAIDSSLTKRFPALAAALSKNRDQLRAMVGMSPLAPATTAADFQRTDKDTTAVPLPKPPSVGLGTALTDTSAFATLKESIAKTREEFNSYNAAIGRGIRDNSLFAATFEAASRAAETLGIVLEKPTQLIERDLELALAKSAEALRQTAIELKDTGLQGIRFAQEITGINQGLQEFQLRQANTALQAAILNDELTRGAAAVAQQRQQIEDVATSNVRFAISAGQAANSLREETITLQDLGRVTTLVQQEIAAADNATLGYTQRVAALNELLLSGSISNQQYAESMGRIPEELLTAGQLLDRYNLSSARELELTNKKKTALNQLIENYRAAGGEGTEAFRKTAEALGLSGEKANLVVAQYGALKDKQLELAKSIEDSTIRAANTFVDEFTSAFVQGKNVLNSFKSFFTNILQDIASQMIRSQIASPLANLLTSFAGNLFGGISLPGRAMGGPVTGGAPYMIGERGPELFVPGRSGSIVPNNALGSSEVAADSNGGGALVVNFTLQAVDTQTGVQFLLQNKPVITSMISEAYNRRGRRGPLD